MRTSAITSVVVHTLIAVVAFLWLLWFFIPAGNLIKGLITLSGVMLAGGYLWKSRHWHGDHTGDSFCVSDFPLLETREPVVLVCGDSLDELFCGQQLRKTAQGWWLRVAKVSTLADVVRTILEQQPRQAGQLSVMYVCQPDSHQDKVVLRESFKVLRHQLNQAGTLAGFTLPLILNGEFSGPKTPWVIVQGDKPVVYPDDETPLTLDDWQQTEENFSALPVLGQAFAFMRETLLDELGKADRLWPSVRPFAVVLRIGTQMATEQSVWSHWLWRHIYLKLPVTVNQSAQVSRFPDAVLTLLTPFSLPAQGGQRTRQLILFLWLCVFAALVFSASNNRYLIRQISADLQRWYAIPVTHYASRTQLLTTLKQDALLLERWQRQGEPARYGLGYYPGLRLLLALQQAIDSHVAAPEPLPAPKPKMIGLNSMSLFDSGKATLRSDSARVLVNALVDIKAKPGWLIVISGHTDNSGNGQGNQTLSVQRALAVRDWMRDNGDIPENCFTVQGYGDSRPVASNDTPEGRARNRRVEISLLPQNGACSIPAGNLSSSQQDGDTPYSMKLHE